MSHEPDLVCEDDPRRDDVRRSPYVNGLDYLEFADQALEPGKPVRLWIYFLDKAPEVLRIENIRITGGRRITGLKVIDLKFCREEDPDRDDCMIVTLDRPGDLSTYTLCIVEVDEAGRPTGRLHPDFDPLYACLDFSFQDICPSDLDCKVEPLCLPEPLVEPDIDYLAKDYASFRRLILDRLAVVMPDWQERHVPDLGITLVELLAYTGDYLSYYQDAVATEAYLDTARQRISVRRHVRLMDYALHEGCNARAWICFHTDQDVDLDPQDFYLITETRESGPGGSLVLRQEDLQEIPPDRYEVFEPLYPGEGSLRFCDADLKDPVCLARRLTAAGDPLTRYLLKELPQDFRKQLEAVQDWLPEEVRAGLVAALNRWIEGPNLYERGRFAQVTLRPETRQLQAQSPNGEDLVRFNRMLLEDAFPSELARRSFAGERLYLYAAQSRMRFYTWGNEDCCLPAGSTRATLLDEWEPLPSPGDEGQYPDPAQKGTYPAASPSQKQAGETGQTAYPPEDPCDRLRKLRHLQPGDVLILEEVIGPETGDEDDADPSHRHAVRLTRVEFGVDRLYDTPVVEIEWAAADALPFPLCLSTTSDPPDCLPLHDVSLACGNVILVDHGRRQDEPLGCVPVVDEGEFCEEDCYPNEPQRVPGKFRPQLKDPLGGGELTFSQPIPPEGLPGCPPDLLPAIEMVKQDPRRALPWITLLSQPDPACRPTPPQEPAGSDTPATTWIPRADLLSSSSYDAHFVVEMDNARRAHLRFGDGELGRRPEGWTSFQASYRVGNGKRGNVGAETILHLVFRQNPVTGLALSLCNPLPAQGGADPEPLEEARLFAPHAFRLELARAITAEDYAAIVMRDFASQVQRAAASLRWMGSWHEVLVAVDPRGQEQASPELLEEIEVHLEDYRRIGHDVIVSQAEYVPLEIDLLVCVLPGYLRGHVKASLLDLLSNRRLRDGSLGFFHPDNLSFGEGVYLSRLIAAVQAIAGVESVTVNVFKRLFEAPNQEIENGLLPLGPLEVARLDNDPNFPENGKLTLTLRGGR